MSVEGRRASIIAAARPLLVEFGAAVTTKQIAGAAGIAEGTVFRAFADKDTLLRAVFEAAADVHAVERALAEIDPSRPFDDQLTEAVAIMQRRLRDLWQLAAALGLPPGPPKGGGAKSFTGLVAIFAAHRRHLSYPPLYAAQALRALTLAFTHPSIAPDRPPKAREIVSLFLDGARAPERPDPC